jgi:hypothetical protein
MAKTLAGKLLEAIGIDHKGVTRANILIEKPNELNVSVDYVVTREGAEFSELIKRSKKIVIIDDTEIQEG